MIFCDRQLVDTAIQLILEADTGIEVVSSRNYNEPFARELTEILIAHGARETRKRDSDDSGHQKKMGAAIDG